MSSSKKTSAGAKRSRKDYEASSVSSSSDSVASASSTGSSHSGSGSDTAESSDTHSSASVSEPTSSKKARTAESVNVADTDKRRLKAWKRATAGAAPTVDGKFAHSWNEHRKDGSHDEFKYGKWTAEEDKRLLEAYDEYCLFHGLTGEDRIKPVIDSVAGTDIHDCWKEVAAVFKHRTIRAVLRRAIRLLHPGNFRGDWEDEDFRLLTSLVDTHGMKWKEIGRIMNRLPNSVRNTYFRMTSPEGAETSHGIWNSNEENRLAAAVKKLGTVGDSGAMTNIPWAAVAKEVATRSEGQCIQKWSSGFGAKVMGQVWDTAADLALVKAVYEDGGETKDEVYWDKLCPGRSATDCRRRFETLSKRVLHHSTLPFDKIVKRLRKLLKNEQAPADESFAAAYERRKGKPAAGTSK